MRILERENYYSVINGYKDLFLLTDSSGVILSPEEYKKSTTFEEIFSLYCFDRDLRNTLIEYLLIFESSIKSKISYRFSEKYKEPHAYLVMKNYSRDPKLLKDVLRLISTISNTISTRGQSKNSPISHYLDKHDGVPLWVLVNYLTLGTISYFYKCIPTTLKNDIAKDFAKAFKREYGLKTTVHFTPEMLEAIIKTANHFRNVCAHEERLYSFSLDKPAKSSQISTLLNIPNSLLNNGNIFTIVTFLKLVLTKKEHNNLIKKLKKLFKDYDTSFSSVKFIDISTKMGFPTNWEKLF